MSVEMIVGGLVMGAVLFAIALERIRVRKFERERAEQACLRKKWLDRVERQTGWRSRP